MAFLLRHVSSRVAIGRSMFLRQMTSSSFEVSSQSSFRSSFSPVLFRQPPSQPTVSFERDWSQNDTDRKGGSLLLSLSVLMGVVLAEETRQYSEADSGFTLFSFLFLFLEIIDLLSF